MKTDDGKHLVQLKELEAGCVVLPPMLDVNTASWYLGVSAKTLRNQLSNNTFPVKPVKHVGKVLFRKRDLDAYIDGLGGI